MKNPADLLYSKTHEWAKIEGSKAKIGITDFAQHELGDLVFVNLPKVGAKVEIGKAFTDVESVKAVSDVMSSVAGTITAVNEALGDSPELLNQDAYENWIIEVEVTGKAGAYLTAEEYEEFAKNSKKGH